MQKKEIPGLYLQSPRLNQLNILREVAADAHITQAELASRCSLSVAMVNNYMKELCKNGLMEYHRKSIKSITYHLTPAGAQQVEMLQLELISEMVGMFAASKARIWNRIAGQSPIALKRVALLGSGHLAQLAYHALEMAGVAVVGVFGDDMDLIGGKFCGKEVESPARILSCAMDAIIVARSPESTETARDLESLTDRGILVIRLDSDHAAASGGNSEIPSWTLPPSVPSDPGSQMSLSLPRNR